MTGEEFAEIVASWDEIAGTALDLDTGEDRPAGAIRLIAHMIRSGAIEVTAGKAMDNLAEQIACLAVSVHASREMLEEAGIV